MSVDTSAGQWSYGLILHVLFMWLTLTDSPGLLKWESDNNGDFLSQARMEKDSQAWNNSPNLSVLRFSDNGSEPHLSSKKPSHKPSLQSYAQNWGLWSSSVLSAKCLIVDPQLSTSWAGKRLNSCQPRGGDVKWNSMEHQESMLLLCFCLLYDNAEKSCITHCGSFAWTLSC